MARDLLDAISQIGGWTWRETSPNRIVIEKPEPPGVRPGEIRDVPVAMQRALTPDLSVFLGIGQNAVAITQSDRVKIASGDGVSTVLLPQIRAKVFDINQSLGDQLCKAILPMDVTIKQAAERHLSRAYTDLTTQQKEYATEALLMYELDECALFPTRYQALTGAFSRYETDPGSLRVHLGEDNFLNFSLRTDLTIDGKSMFTQQGFGWALGPPTNGGIIHLAP
jgi:hypothetical protein